MRFNPMKQYVLVLAVLNLQNLRYSKNGKETNLSDNTTPTQRPDWMTIS